VSVQRALLHLLLLGLSSVGCASPGREFFLSPGSSGRGQIEFDLTVAGGGKVAEVGVTIRGAMLSEPMVKKVPVLGASSTVSVYLDGLLPGNYEMDLKATTEDGQWTCEGTGPFQVTAGQLSSLVVPLSCRGVGDGSPNPGNSCPRLESLSAVPNVAAVFDDVAISAAASDAEGNPLSFEWSAASGQFSTVTGPSTTYTCLEPGIHALVLTLDDGRNCDRTYQFSVTCQTAGTCGNGVLDPGEDCEPSLTTGCGEDCGFVFELFFCGDGTVDPGEECDPPNESSCDASCLLR
jgi:hypothetical protein